MEGKMRKTLLGVFVAVLSVCQGAHALSLEINPVAQTRNVGQVLAYDVWVRGVGAEILTGFDIDLSYDPAVLGLTSLAFGTGLNKGNPADSLQWQSASPSPGTLNAAEVTWLPDADLITDQPDDFVLFSLGFAGIAPGTSALRLTLHTLSGHAEPDPSSPCPPCMQLPVELFADSLGDASATILAPPPGDIPEPSMPSLAFLAMLGLSLSRGLRPLSRSF